HAAMQVQATSNGRAVIVQYLPWLTLDKSTLDQGDAVTGQLELLRLFSAGALVRLPGATTKLEPLVQSSPDSMLLDAPLLMATPDRAGPRTRSRPPGRACRLAGPVRGPARPAFPGGPPAPAKAADADAANGTAGSTAATTAAAPALKESSQP